MPDLQERFTQPAGWQWQERFETRKGEYIRFGWAIPESPRALVVVLPGLSEYCEKYFETTRDLLARGFAVCVIDWRGQGLSWRHLPDRTKRHEDDFRHDVADAHSVINYVIAQPGLSDLPKIMLAHSMGGHIGIRYLHDYKNVFNIAAFSAPMQGIYLPYSGQGIIYWLARAIARVRGPESYVPGGMPWSEAFFRVNLLNLTSDRDRIDMQFHWMRTKPDLQPGGLTYGWLLAAMSSNRRALTRNYLEGIDTPCLFSIAEKDRVVSNASIEKTAARLPRVETIHIKGCLHEVLMERDEYRNQFLRAFDGFVAKHLKAG